MTKVNISLETVNDLISQASLKGNEIDASESSNSADGSELAHAVNTGTGLKVVVSKIYNEDCLLCQGLIQLPRMCDFIVKF